MSSINEGRIVRIGFVYDGGYFARISDYYRYIHDRRSRLSFDGVHAFARHEIAEREQIDIRYCHIVESLYFRGRFSAEATSQADKLLNERRFDDVLVRAGITPHYLLRRGKDGEEEKGVDVWLALECFELAIRGRVDVVVLVTGDQDFVPLVRKLNSVGVRVMLLAWDHEWSDNHGQRHYTRVAQQLIDQATYPVMVHTVIDDRAKKADPIVNALFVQHSDDRERELSLGGEHARGTEERDPTAASEYGDQRWGRILSLKDNYGFIQESEGGKSWFFHGANIVDADFAGLIEGNTVKFRIGKGRSGLQAVEVYTATSPGKQDMLGG